MEPPTWEELDKMHGRIHVMSVKSEERHRKKVAREARAAEKAAKMAQKEARYQIRLKGEIEAVQQRVAYMQSQEANMHLRKT